MNISQGHKEETILLVDDNQDNLILLARVLNAHGYRTRKISSATQALACARNDKPDLIFLDITMPEINGYEFCTHLKEDKNSQDIPIIFMSALHDTFDIRKAFAVGGADYITKPIELDRLFSITKTHLKNGNSSKLVKI